MGRFGGGKHYVALTQSALDREGTLWFRIEGTSMNPVLRSGDRVQVQPCTLEALAFGDLALFTKRQTFCLHRVMGTMKKHGVNWLITKGDGCGRWDRPVTAASIVGRAVAIDRRGRLQLLDTVAGRLSALLCGVGSVAVGWGLWLKWRLQR